MNTIENRFLKADFDERGALHALRDKRTGTDVVQGAAGEAWRLTIADPGPAPLVIGSAGSACAVARERDGLTFTFDSITVGGKSLPVRLETQVQAEGPSLVWRARISNGAGRVVESMEFPILSGVLLRSAEAALYRPKGAGERIARPDACEAIEDLQYPPASMQWLDYSGPTEGIYFASHDASFETTLMSTRPEGGSLRLAFTKHPFLKTGESWRSAPFVGALHSGGWHEGARLYRAWADSWFRHPAPPEWVADLQGWFLVILKQQNGQAMWTYKDLPAMLDFAEASGISMIGAFGWGIGGHDHLYPDYSVAPELGSLPELKDSIARVKARGGRVILYTNGQLIDTNGEYYRSVGKRIAAKDRGGTEHSEHWHKFADHSGYVHAIACQATAEWGDKLVELAEYVEGLGADGIIFDQIGGGSRGRLCFDAAHGHRTPAEAMGPAIVRNLERARVKVKAKNPEFCFITEHVGDAVCQSIDYIHGSGFGVQETPTSFPALFRYTFPEYRFTNREAGAPYRTFRQTNFAVVHGMGMDLESRYAPDVSLIRTGKRPGKEDYANVTSPPIIDVLASGPIEDYRRYLKNVLSIRAGSRVLEGGS